MNVGEKIKQIRKSKGLSAETVAERIGVSPATVYRYESQYIENMGIDKLIQIARVLDVDPSMLLYYTDDNLVKNKIEGIRIPVLGYVRADIPIDAIEEIIDYEEIHPNMADSGDYFALQIKGDSMEPKFSEGDVVIVREQPDVESGEIAIVLVNGDEGTVKELVKYDNGSIALVALNPAYPPMMFTPEQIETLPVRVIGKVVELRAKF